MDNKKYILITVNDEREIHVEQFSSYDEAWKEMHNDVIQTISNCDIPIMNTDYEINQFTAHVNVPTQAVDWKIEEVEFTPSVPVEEDTHHYIMTQSILDWIEFEQNSSHTYPYSVVFPSDDQIKAIASLCSSDDTEEIHKNCEKVLGINPDIILKKGNKQF